MYTAMHLFISMPSYKTNSCANSEILYRALLNGFAAQVSNHSKEVTYKRSKKSPIHRRKKKNKTKKIHSAMKNFPKSLKVGVKVLAA
jgi:hypothetical protein